MRCPGSDLNASIDRYTRFFARPPDFRAGERSWGIPGLDALLERHAWPRIEHEAIETDSTGVRHVKIPDPDGNALAFAEPPGP